LHVIGLFSAALLVLGCFSCASVARAAEISVRDAEGFGGNFFIALEGTILPGDADRFRMLASRPNLRGLMVSSPGGSINEAYKLGRLISSLGLPVQAQGECASACPLLLLSSPQRSITTGTRVGFHSARTFDGEAHAVTVQLARIYQELGVPNDVLGGLVTNRPGEMYWVNSKQISSMNITIKPPLWSPVRGQVTTRETLIYFFDQHLMIITVLFFMMIFPIVWTIFQIRRGSRVNRNSQASLPVTALQNGASGFPINGSLGKHPINKAVMAQDLNGIITPGSCPNCNRSLPGGKFRSCPACGHILKASPYPCETRSGRSA
jgi:hypothetical protein